MILVVVERLSIVCIAWLLTDWYVNNRNNNFLAIILLICLIMVMRKIWKKI